MMEIVGGKERQCKSQGISGYEGYCKNHRDNLKRIYGEDNDEWKLPK